VGRYGAANAEDINLIGDITASTQPRSSRGWTPLDSGYDHPTAKYSERATTSRDGGAFQ
jgi:hypothetical protein